MTITFRKIRMHIISGILILVIVYFVFTSGIIFELAKYNNTDTLDIPYSIAMSSNRLDIGGVFVDNDAKPAKLIQDIINSGNLLYIDYYSYMILVPILDWNSTDEVHKKMTLIPWDTNKIHDDAYIYLRTRSVNEKTLSYVVGYGQRRITRWDEVNLKNVLHDRDILFDDGSRVYGPKR